MVWLVGILICGVAPARVEGQVWRLFRVTRSIGDTSPVQVHVNFGEGAFELRPSAASGEYSMFLKYDADRSLPRHSFDSAAHTITLGSSKPGGKIRVRGDYGGEARVELPPGVPTRLTVDVGATTSTLVLGGLAISTLHFRAGASQSAIRFDTPNLVQLTELVVDGSAASVRASGLANARAPRINVQTHLGTVDLEFGGDWTADVSADLRVVLGAAVIRVPSAVGVEVEISHVLSSFSPDGFTKQGEVYRSPNWSDSAYKLRIKASSILGRISVIRTAG